MKKLAELSKNLVLFSDKTIERLVKAQRDTANKICNDVKSLAPGTGNYISSIKVSNTTVENGVIKTAVYTDMVSDSDPTIVIGRMIEHGTGIYALEPHIGHTKAFIESGYRYWFVPATSVKRAIGQLITINGTEFYIAKPQRARPHFLPSLLSNKPYYKAQIRKALIGL